MVKGKDLLEKINKWESHLIQRDQKTFQDVINFPNRLNAEIVDLSDRAGGHDPRLTSGMRQRKVDLESEWKILKDEMDSIIASFVVGYNLEYDALGLPALIVPNEMK
jgi:hypothetical protein